MTVQERKAADRPAVLIVEAHDERRHALSRGLAEAGYDVTPAMTAQEGLRFARGLGPSVIVGPVELIAEGGAEILEHCIPGHALERTILLLGETRESTEIPDEVRFLSVLDLSNEEILHRVRLVLLGREIGVETDLELHSLVGELSLVPFLELVRSLHRCRLTGRLELSDGFVAFDHGSVIAAAVYRVHPAAARLGIDQVRGVKAFCRLARRRDGPFYVVAQAAGEEREIDDEVPDLVMQALEESLVALPPARTRPRVIAGGRVPSGQFATHQNLLLDVISRCETVEELLDSVPSTDARIAQALDKLIESGFVSLERPRSAVAVVTDSTADLPPDLVHAHDINVVPLAVRFGDQVLRDGIDLSPRDFYQMLETEERHPSTEPPSEAEFFEHFVTLGEQRDVLAVHISSKLSLTLEHAKRAALKVERELERRRSGRRSTVELIDSGNVSMSVGLLALFAARMAFRGEPAGAISRRLRQMSPRLETLFVVNTLEYLERGGRIGRARAWVGRLLGIKPILGVVDGEISPIDRVRRGRQAHPRMVKLFKGHLREGQPVVAAVAHARAPVWAERLRALLAKDFEILEMIVTDIGPVVGTHTGPGTVGATLFQPSEEERRLIAPLD